MPALIATIAPDPESFGLDRPPERDQITAQADTYEQAGRDLDAAVPTGWSMLHIRTED